MNAARQWKAGSVLKQEAENHHCCEDTAVENKNGIPGYEGWIKGLMMVFKSEANNNQMRIIGTKTLSLNKSKKN